MQKKPTKERPLNDVFGVNIGLPSLSETGYAVFTTETVLAAYEKEARDVLKAQGYPLTLVDLWNEKDKLLPDLANGRGLAQVYSIFWMLWNLEKVREHVDENNADQAACHMAVAVHWAITARLKPVVWKIDVGAAFTDRKDKGFADKIKKQKKIREAFARTLVMKHPTHTAAELVRDVLDRSVPHRFEHGGEHYNVVSRLKKGRSGERSRFIRFESSKTSFDYAEDTFLKTLRNAKK